MHASLPLIEAHYMTNMGSGFNLDVTPDPVAVLVALNDHAECVSERAVCERYIGNMANLSIEHPRIGQFTRVKVDRRDLVHFNISVNVTDRFFRAIVDHLPVTHDDGSVTDSTELWNDMVMAAWSCGDPGLLFLDRFNRDNPTPTLGDYRTTAPCAEVGLTQGESCIFGYLNLGRFLSGGSIDFDRLGAVTMALVRVLDDAVEISIDRYPADTSRSIMAAKRKIGIGVCGLADLLAAVGLPYSSPEAVEMTREVLAWITYTSKLASVRLADERGAFPAFPMSRYATTPGFLSSKFGKLGTRTVTSGDWERLELDIRRRGSLRNSTTTALPPSGRTALILEASNSIEPWFSIVRPDGALQPPLLSWLAKRYPHARRRAELVDALIAAGTCQAAGLLPREVQEIYKCATEIEPVAHLRLAAAATECVDEGASKTINLPADSTPTTVGDIFWQAWDLGLKAVSVYRAGSVEAQGGARTDAMTTVQQRVPSNWTW
jgi:ribonucleoside-diphosphate reductase alpha chain